jgi:uncharacterized protein (TIGR03663 family)
MRWLRSQPRGELIAYAALVVVALVVRLWDLGDRPFHHDESQDAYFSWTFAEHGDYAYNPLLHGPVRFFMTAAVYLLAGDSDFTARLAPVLMGTAMVALAWALRPLLGRVAAFAVAVLLAVGPSYLYFSRFAREDIYIACISMALLIVVFRFLANPRPWQPAVMAALLATAFATKESTFITVFVAGTFFLAWLALDHRRGEPRLWRTVASVGWESWVWALATFLFVQTVLFTTFFTDPQHWDGLWEGLDYWLGQHEVGRGGEPWFFYIVVLFAHEWPALLLGAVGTAVVIRRPTPLRVFAVWAFLLSLAVYSWAGEKFSWLVLHPLLPLLLLAGLGVQALWRARRTPLGRAGLAVAAVAAVYVVVASWSVNAVHRADPREFLVSTQSSEDVLKVRDEVLRAVATFERNTGRPPAVTVDSAEGATFPWAWYLRHVPGVGYIDLSKQDAPPQSEILLLTDASRQRLAASLRGYEGRRFRFRVWWVRDYGEQSPSAWARWFTEREPWNPPGGMPAWVMVQRGLTG